MSEAGFDFSAFHDRLSREAEQLLHGPKATAGEAARVVQQRAERTLAEHRQPDSLIACGPGCGYCCIVNVAVLEPEVAAITDFLASHLSAAELEELHSQAEELRLQVFGLVDDERLLLQRSCLFLDGEKSCRIYPVRPLLCRALTSTDAGRCREALAMAAFGEQPSILANLFQQQLFHQAFFALAHALERCGREHRSLTLTEAIYQWFQAASQPA